jgi:hypothetical protein
MGVVELDLEAFEHGLKIFSFRVWIRTQFKSPSGWTPVLRALVDTGAPFSVLPKSLWTAIDSEGGFATHLRGLVPLRSAVLNARLSQVACLVSDLKTSAPPLSFWALLADGEVPLVLGCAGFLDRAKLVLDAAHERAHLEFSP